MSLLLKSSLKALADDPEEAKERFQAAAKANAEPCPSCGKVIIHRKGISWCLDNEMSEKTLQARVVSRAKTRGWRVEHVGKGMATFDSRGDPIWVTTGDSGWPDLTLAKAGHRLVFLELKTMRGEVSPDQFSWLKLLNQTGNFAVVVRPNHLRDKTVNAILDQGAPL